VEHLRQSIQLEPDWPEASNELAWLLATSPDPAISDPREALSLSQRAVDLSGGKHPGVLDTHAAAQAAAGQYLPAVATAEAAARLADSLHADTLAKALRGRIAT
jgi:serine/threonine-protein kinase